MAFQSKRKGLFPTSHLHCGKRGSVVESAKNRKGHSKGNRLAENKFARGKRDKPNAAEKEGRSGKLPAFGL
jgi:hypothetical protein